MKRKSNEEYLADLNQRLAPRDAIAKAERAVVEAAERWKDAPDYRCHGEVRALMLAVEALRTARKAGK